MATRRRAPLLAEGVDLVDRGHVARVMHFAQLVQRVVAVLADAAVAERLAPSVVLRVGASPTSARITSYNVCYTKLLRNDRWLEIVEEEPTILRMPLVRSGNALTVGHDEAVWKGWFSG